MLNSDTKQNNVYIDLRSDTVTKPTPAMRAKMAEAEVGDDIYKDDPTVNALEARVAQITGKERALFVPSGTMGNQICIKTHTRAGEEIILHRKSHIFVFEAGAAALISGVMTNLVDGENGYMDLEAIQNGIKDGSDMHQARTSLICMENTHNICGGTVVSPEHMKKIYDLAKENDIAVHLDGARIFNAAVYLKTDVKNIARYADSVMFCLSKGLGAPVGSMICGDEQFIERAVKVRKMLGGALRQAGVLAAAGLHSLDTMPDKLHIDHENAAYFAQTINGSQYVSLSGGMPQTNIVNVTLRNTKTDAGAVAEKMKKEGVLINGEKGSKHIRFVFHRDNADRKDVARAADVFLSALE